VASAMGSAGAAAKVPLSFSTRAPALRAGRPARVASFPRPAGVAGRWRRLPGRASAASLGSLASLAGLGGVDGSPMPDPVRDAPDRCQRARYGAQSGRLWARRGRGMAAPHGLPRRGTLGRREVTS
jgi:hypothetical protein